jgi:ubiquinone/menaquinone biosynthesis C-methylase UbiE
MKDLTHQPMPYTHAPHLLNPIRSLILSPRTLVRRLSLKPDFTVLELGPGPGFFSPAIAHALPNGKLVLVDVQQEMLDMARKRIDGHGLSNVDCRQGNAVSLPVESASCDVAVLGEVANRSTCLREVHRVLRPGGLLSVTEFKVGDPDFVPMSELLPSVQAAGFQYCARHGICFHYTVNFRNQV